MQLTRQSRTASTTTSIGASTMPRQAYHKAVTMRERFPNVEELVVRVTFTDTQRFGTYSALMHSFSPSARHSSRSPARARYV
jgi:hypothetical protein